MVTIASSTTLSPTTDASPSTLMVPDLIKDTITAYTSSAGMLSTFTLSESDHDLLEKFFEDLFNGIAFDDPVNAHPDISADTDMEPTLPIPMGLQKVQ
ncbi:hypothetical protein N0V90_000610 [Kalmusia sp. IMI 367209]|nr:hypothetical protein N0V90_000610 [Kalmusia sp. IMI 367209]